MNGFDWNILGIVFALLGGMLAAGIITVRMIMDDKYKTAEEIRRYTGLATLAVVPVEEPRKNTKQPLTRDRRKA